jgi:S-DNA-T family DNA segregation ATPase FtsK/SpoIIIE
MPKKNKAKEDTGNGKEYFVVSPAKKKKLLGIFLILFAVLIFLSILSYSRYDDSSFSFRFTDLFNVFSSNPELRSKAAGTYNWLGIFGAYISYFFIHSTLGYFSLIFPVIMFVWGYSVLRAASYKLAIYVTNFLLVMGILISTFFGMLRFTPEFGLFTDVYELSGNIGAFFGIAISKLLGPLGSIIFLIAAMIVTLIIAFDIRLSGILEFLKKFYKSDETAEAEVKVKPADEESEENINKIKSLRSDKKLKSLLKQDDEIEAEEIEDELPETRIRIVKKDEPEKVIEPEFPKEELPKSKKIDLSKSDKPKGDDSLPVIDKEAEASLPDQWDENIKFNPPTLDLLTPAEDEEVKIHESELKRNAELLKEKLALFDIQIEDITVTPGPVVTLYEIVPAPGVKISRIVSLEHDIALALAARGIRIIAPIPVKALSV